MELFWEVISEVQIRSVQLPTEVVKRKDNCQLMEEREFVLQYGKGRMMGVLQIQNHPRMSK